jgi:hypothetical protein
VSTRILDGLGLVKAARVDELADQSQSFMPINVSMHDLRIGTLLDLVHREDGLLPPRTGHLGNWGDIALGRSGPMDFNTAVCGPGHGYPLVYGFNRTEAEIEGGDDVYLPGSLVDEGERTLLPLFTWDGSGFVRRDRSRPLFCPVVQTELDGQLVPLIDVHWQRVMDIPGYRFEQWAAGLVDNYELMVELLCVLFEDARCQPNPGRGLIELISHSARLDGEVSRCEMSLDGDGYLLDGHRFDSTRALAEAVMLPLRALTEPKWFFEHIAELPPVLPVISLLLTNVLFAVLGVHRPDETGVPDEGPFITHLHWGARAMAGCPPRRNGYFARRSRVRPMRTITAPLVKHFPQIKPICFVLLPAPVFMLCPPSTSPQDVARMDRLVRSVLAATPDAAYDTALAELGSYGTEFSDYLNGRFDDGSGVLRDGRLREPAVPVEPAGFRDLTFRQASAMVAAFEQVRNGGIQ